MICAWCGERERRVRLGAVGERVDLEPVLHGNEDYIMADRVRTMHPYCWDALQRFLGRISKHMRLHHLSVYVDNGRLLAAYHGWNEWGGGQRVEVVDREYYENCQ